MKKMMMMAMLLMASASVFAGDSDALKAILKTKTYTDAETLVKSTADQLANDQEKAKAYNQVVKLAYEAFKHEDDIAVLNATMQKNEPVNEQVKNDAAYTALLYAVECDKYDQKPNEKGKVAPKFGMKNAQRLWNGPRNALVNAGQEALSAQDNATARKYWQLFAESNEFPFFKACDREAQKPYFGQVARFAAIFAYQDKDMDKALQLADIAMKDPEEYENALNLKLEVLGNELKSKEDSVNYCGKLKDIYAEHKTDGVMEKLYNVMLGLGEADAAMKILDDALVANPNNFVALADKGLALLQAQKAAEAVNYLKKAYEVKSDNAVIATYAGTAYSVQAQETEDPAQKKALYKQAIELFDKAKELDPDRLQSNWGYNRYNAYYNYYGPDAAETQQAEADSK